MISFMLLMGCSVMAIIGRIDYRYHYADKETVGVIRREEAPFRFWSMIGPLFVVSAAGTVVGLSKLRREEKGMA